MRWNHPSPNMTSGGPDVKNPGCRARVYRSRVTGSWAYHCAAHPRRHTFGTWALAMSAARYHARTAPRHYDQ